MENKETIYELPEDWILTTLGEIGIVVSGGTPSSRQPDFWGGDIAWITPADLSNYKNKYIEQGQRSITKVGLDNSSAKLLPKGTVLFSSRAPIGYTVIAKNDIATNQGFKNLILTKSGYPDYIYYYLQASKQLAESYASGTTFLELSAAKFSQIPFPLPPLEEQYRIVDKIEELFSELDKSQENLLNAQKQLEIYRQVVLKDAFENKNTQFVKLNKIINGVQYGYTAKSDFNQDGAKYLRITDIQDSNIVWNQVPSCVINETNLEKYKLFEGDILFARVGNTVGKTILIGENVPESVFASYLIRISPKKEKISPEFLNYYFKSNHYWKQIIESAAGVAQPNINGSKLKELLVPISSIHNQKEIIQEIELKFSLIDNLRKSLEDNLKRIRLFRQIILQKAFSGKLLKQDKSDESANELLQRIGAEKAVYERLQKEIAKNKPQKLVFMESKKTIEEILEEATEPIEAKEVWQKSIYKDDIEKFYEELKQLSDSIEVSFEGITSKLSLKR